MQSTPYRCCVEFCPLDAKQVKDGKKVQYLVFDSDFQLNQAIYASPVLRHIRRVKKYFSVVLNEDGELVV